jgi:hypothetical protein
MPPPRDPKVPEDDKHQPASEPAASRPIHPLNNEMKLRKGSGSLTPFSQGSVTREGEKILDAMAGVQMTHADAIRKRNVFLVAAVIVGYLRSEVNA